MASEVSTFDITIPIYEGVNLMDVAAPVELFHWMGVHWKEKHVTISLAAKNLRTVHTETGLLLTPTRTFQHYYEQPIQADLIWVPGANLSNGQEARILHNKEYLQFLQQQSTNAAYITSVCEGALLLAAAGLLDGYHATTHWAVIPCLKTFHKVKVVDGFPRFVIDGNRVTGGGVSSGFDEALKIISLIAGDAIAKQAQMITQYFPDPPFHQKITPQKECKIRKDMLPQSISAEE